MPTSVFSAPKPRVQKIGTLWTHDDNFSREDIVFNGDKFPELPVAPGSLLQIVAITNGTAVRDFQGNTSNSQIRAFQAMAQGAAMNRELGRSHARRERRGSITITIDENGVPVPGGRDVDAEKAYIFVSKPLSADLKAKHTNLQVSISEKIAKVFGFRNRMQIIVTEANEDRHEAHHVELVFRDEYLARADMWRLAVSELSNRTVYRGQKILFMGTIKATIKHIYVNNQSVQSGYFSSRSKPVFRSESARYVLFLQMSREMWDFDAEGAGEIMFNKVVSGFLPDLFKRWLKINARHLVTIILFTRMQYEDDSLLDCPLDTTRSTEPQVPSGTFRDYYRVVVSDMASGDWINILYQLKKEFRNFLREVSLVRKKVPRTSSTGTLDPEAATTETVVAGKPSSASQGNILEAINLAAAQYAKDYIDRDLVRTGISVIVVTPGTGVFEVDYSMLKLTTDTLMGSGIGIDLVCLSPMPLHSVPLFTYRTPRTLSKLGPETDESNKPVPAELSRLEEEKTPRQYHSNFAPLSRTLKAPSIHSFTSHTHGHHHHHHQEDGQDEWRFAMPYWIDISFWSGSSDEVLEPTTKLRKPDKIIHATTTTTTTTTRKKGRIFSLRCRLYELQMMGALENEFGEISIPYLEEDPVYLQHLRHAGTTTKTPLMDHSFPERERGQMLQAPVTAASSYSSGDRHYGNDQLDNLRACHKAWMEAYDSGIYSPLLLEKRNPSATESQSRQPKQSETIFSRSPDHARGSFLSSSFRSAGTSFGKTVRPVQDASFHQLKREQSREEESQSPKANTHRLLESRTQGAPRADVSRRQQNMMKASAGIDRISIQHRVDQGELEHKSHRSTPRQSPLPSRGPSPPRRIGASPAMSGASTSIANYETKTLPGNWFLRQISFGGKAAAAKPTIADATIDLSQGKVKPAMLTVEKNQKGAIAERLASTRFTTDEKPSQPIAIRTVSRCGPTSAESLSSNRASGSVETVRGGPSGKTSIPSHSGSIKRDPGSTFLLAGARGLSEHVVPKLDLSSSGGARDIPQTLSPTSAIAPWAVLVNPCNPKKNEINTRNQYRRWHHVFPRTLRTGTVKWRSLCSPAAVPLTHDWFPTSHQIATEYNESPYKISQNEDDDTAEAPKSRESLIKELIAFRLSHGFQVIVGSSVAEFSGRKEKALASIFAPDYMSTDGDTIFMSLGNSIHQLVCVAGGEVEVRRYSRKPTTALEAPGGMDVPLPYKPYIRTAMEDNYGPRDVVLRPPRKEYNWNIIDTFLAGYQDEFSDVLRFWRARFVLIPVDIPPVHRRPLPMLTEDSEEEMRLEGIQKLTQLWQKFRYISPDERSSQPSVFTKQKDPNPLDIKYHTRDLSAIVAAGPDDAIFHDTDSEVQPSLYAEAEKYHRSSIDLKKLAEDLQGEKGIDMLDRRWHLKLHQNCFVGLDLTNWLLSNIKDVETREEAVEVGNELMHKGLFVHVQGRHQFRDGNYFFQLAAEYRAPRPESRTGWFGMRKTDKSVPSTPLTDAPRSSPLASKVGRNRPSTADSSSSQSDSVEDSKASTRSNGTKRQVTLSRVMRYDVDPRKRSYRPEVISLHYDRLHNPDNCYHIRIDWMNVTAKLIEDAIVTWATSVEKYGLKLVEVPIAEACSIGDYHPFQSPYLVKLALQPPPLAPSDEMWESGALSPQSSSRDRFVYHKALLRKLNFVLDMEAADSFPSEVQVRYSWGVPDYKYTQFIHRSGTLVAQITDEGQLLLLANRLAHNRAKDHGRLRPVDPYEHKKATMDGSQSTRGGAKAGERSTGYRSPFGSPVVRAVQDASLLHAALAQHDRPAAGGGAGAGAGATQMAMTAEQVKDEVEAFCHSSELLSAVYREADRHAPSPSPRMAPLLDDKIPSLGLPPAITMREASPSSSSWAMGSMLGLGGRGERGILGGMSEGTIGGASGIAGRRQGSESSMSTLGKRAMVEGHAENRQPRRQSSQGSAGGNV